MAGRMMMMAVPVRRLGRRVIVAVIVAVIVIAMFTVIVVGMIVCVVAVRHAFSMARTASRANARALRGPGGAVNILSARTGRGCGKAGRFCNHPPVWTPN